MAEWKVTAEDIAACTGIGAEECRTVLEDLFAHLARQGADPLRASSTHLERYFYALALGGANTRRIARAERVVRAYYRLVAAAPDPCAEIPSLCGVEPDQEAVIRAQWRVADAFYGVPPAPPRRPVAP